MRVKRKWFQSHKALGSVDVRELTRRLTQAEGGAVNLPVAQVSELLARLADECAKDPRSFECLLRYINRRLKAANKARKA